MRNQLLEKCGSFCEVLKRSSTPIDGNKCKKEFSLLKVYWYTPPIDGIFLKVR